MAPVSTHKDRIPNLASAEMPPMDLETMVRQAKSPRSPVKHAWWFWVKNYDRKRVSPALQRLVFQRDGFRCLCCGWEQELRVDHVRPVALGGPTTLTNLQTLCDRCNRLKNDRYLDFRPKRARVAKARVGSR